MPERHFSADVHRAIAEGGDSYEEPDFEFGDIWYFQDDDSGMWNHASLAFGYVVNDGVPEYASWLRWSCGDTDVSDSISLDSEDAEAKFMDREHAAARASIVEYVKWVAETGKDPMHHFFVEREREEETRWLFEASQDENDRPYVMRIKRSTDVNWQLLPPEHSEAHIFLGLEGKYIGGAYDEPYMWNDLRFAQNIEKLPGSSSYFIRAAFTVTERVGIPKDEYRAHTRERARQYLEREAQ